MANRSGGCLPGWRLRGDKNVSWGKGHKREGAIALKEKNACGADTEVFIKRMPSRPLSLVLLGEK